MFSAKTFHLQNYTIRKQTICKEAPFVSHIYIAIYQVSTFSRASADLCTFAKKASFPESSNYHKSARHNSLTCKWFPNG